MARYDYGCPHCGAFELRFPIGTATGQAPCPSCGALSRRLFSAPFLREVEQGVARAMQAEERSRDAPGVVGRESLPPRPPRKPPHPALARLPKP
jgi:putative FmdB family regulatory protein